jgi:sugar lactone lactonase YvrE
MRSARNIIITLLIACLLMVTLQLASAALPGPFEPYSIALDNEGNVYVVAAGNASVGDFIHVYSPDGQAIRTIGNGGRQMEELAFDEDGNLYLRDIYPRSNESLAETIKKIDRNGNVSIVASCDRADNVIINGASVNRDGTVCYSEYELSAAGQYLKEVRLITIDRNGTAGVAYAENSSNGFYITAIDRNGTIYACGDASYITVISPDGNVSAIGKTGENSGVFNGLYCVAVGQDGYIYTTETVQGGISRVQKLSPEGTSVMQWEGCGPDKFVGPHSVAVDESGRIYVADMRNQRVVWFTGDYRFGDNVTQNMMGRGVLWGTIVEGYNYSTYMGMIDRENRPGLPYALIGIVLMSLVAMGILGFVIARFYKAGKSLSLVVNSAIAGFAVAVFVAVLSALVIVNWWGIVQSISGQYGLGSIDTYMSAAEGVQVASMIIIIPLLAGALTAYISRSAIKSGRDALLAGVFTGLVALCVCSLCAMTISIIQDLTYTSLGYSIGNSIARAPDILLLTLALPALVVLPLCAAGAFLCRRYMARAENTESQKKPNRAIKVIAVIGSMILVTLIVARICMNYDLPPIVPVMFALPLLATLLALIVDVKKPSGPGAVPVMILILALSVVAVALVPIAEVLLANMINII